MDSNFYVKNDSGCWLWTRGFFADGYGAIRQGKKIKKAHRVSWELSNKTQIPAGLMVRHQCDVRACINPEHLCLGTHMENMRDRNLRNRTAKGTRHGRCKLTEEQVLQIRASDEKGVVLAKQFNVSTTIISRIKAGQSWKHLTPDVQSETPCNAPVPALPAMLEG
jgi:hypothetical protein